MGPEAHAAVKRRPAPPPTRLVEVVPPDQVVLTEHAVSRYIERCALNRMGLPTPDVAERSIRRLLASSVEDDVPVATRTRRLISNRFQPVDYFVASGWRFVLTRRDGRYVLCTCERTKPHQN